VSSDVGSSTEGKKIIRFFFFLFSGSATEILALCSSRWEIFGVFFFFFLYYIHVAHIERRRRRSVTVDEWKENEKKKKERKRISYFFFLLGSWTVTQSRLVSVDVAPSTGEQHAPRSRLIIFWKIYFLMFKNVLVFFLLPLLVRLISSQQAQKGGEHTHTHKRERTDSDQISVELVIFFLLSPFWICRYNLVVHIGQVRVFYQEFDTFFFYSQL
jgi:hypothetical protein